MSGSLEELAEQVVGLAWSRFSNDTARRYVEATDDGDDTSERWRQFRTLTLEKLAARVAAEQAKRATS